MVENETRQELIKLIEKYVQEFYLCKLRTDFFYYEHYKGIKFKSNKDKGQGSPGRMLKCDLQKTFEDAEICV